MNPIQWAIVALFVPLGVAGLLAVVPPLRRAGRPAAALSVAAVLVSVLASVMVLADQMADGSTPHIARWSWLWHRDTAAIGIRSAIELGVHVDGVSAAMMGVVSLVAACVQVFSLGYMADEPPAAYGRYFTYHSLFVFSMLSLVIAPNLLQFFLGWELVGLTSYLLIGFYYAKASAARASLKAFWITKFADMGFILGLITLFVVSGGFEWTASIDDPDAAMAITLFLFVAVMGKSAQFPLHIWLPNAMEGPTPVSALLHAATMVAAGVYLVVRADPLFLQAPTTQEIMVYVGAFTALFAACIAVVQTDIKRVLAYSTCSQLGYMVCALGAGSMVAGYFHLTTHACFKALLFLAAGGLIHGVHSNEITSMGGLLKKMPTTAITFIIGALALAGFPMTAGFFSKDLVLEVVEQRGLWLPFAALMLGAFLTAFYMMRVMVIALLGPPSDAASHAHAAPKVMQGPLVVLAIFALGVGWFGGDFARLAGAEYAFHIGAVGIAASLLGFAGLGLAWWTFSGHPEGRPAIVKPFAPVGAFIRAAAVDRAAQFAYRQVMLGISAAVAWIDRYVVDGLMNASGYACLEAGSRLRRVQTGDVQHYVMAVVVALVALGAWGVWP